MEFIDGIHYLSTIDNIAYNGWATTMLAIGIIAAIICCFISLACFGDDYTVAGFIFLGIAACALACFFVGIANHVNHHYDTYEVYLDDTIPYSQVVEYYDVLDTRENVLIIQPKGIE